MEITIATGTPVAPGQVRLKSAEGPVKFFGELVANSSSDSGVRPQKTKWTELELYRKTDGSSDYVLHVIARSVVYHSIDGCDNGIQVKLGDLAARYLAPSCTEPLPEPCDRCHPLDIESRLVGDTLVMAEVDWHAVYVCPTVDKLLANLRQTKGKNAGQFGMPAMILLDRARQKDPFIADALSQVRDI